MGRHDLLSGTHAQHGQRLQEWGLPQWKYYSSVKHNGPATLTLLM